MKNKDINLDEIYSRLFNRYDSVFPHLELKQVRDKWQTNLKLNGSPAKDKRRKDKTVITAQRPGILYENDENGGGRNVIKYYSEQNGITYGEALRELAKSVGMEIETNNANFERQKQKINILQETESYFNYCLINSTSGEAQEVRDYLKGRGYSDGDFSYFGYIPNKQKLFTHLEERFKNEYTLEQIKEILEINHMGIGRTHKLVIPYYTGRGLIGFKFRTIADDSPKYLNSKFERGESFFNLKQIKGDKDIIIVEGEFDAITATLKGIDNVVGAGGTPTEEQIKNAINRGAKRFTLALDYDYSEKDNDKKQAEARAKIEKLIDLILSTGIDQIYIADLNPNNEKKSIDVDDVIRAGGDFQNVIDNSIIYYKYLLDNLSNEYDKGDDQLTDLTDKEYNSYLAGVVNIATKITSAVDKDLFLNAIHEITGLTKEAFEVEINKLRDTQETEQAKKDFQSLTAKTNKLLGENKIDEALNEQLEGLQKIRLKASANEFEKLSTGLTESELISNLKASPESLDSGFIIGNERILLHSGLTYIAGPTSHGKSTVLMNIALNLAQKYTDKKFYFLSFEEGEEPLTIVALNAYANIRLSNNNRATIQSYLGGQTKHIKRELMDDIPQFEEKRKDFFDNILNKNLTIKFTSIDAIELINFIQYLHTKGNLGGILIDYMQLLRLPADRNYNTLSRQEQMKDIGIKLMNVANELKLPIVLGAQFNRNARSPLDLDITYIGEAGDIERQAQTVIAIWDNHTKIPQETIDKIAQDPISPLEIPRISKKDSGETIGGTMYVEILKNRKGRKNLRDLWSYNANLAKLDNDTEAERKASLFEGKEYKDTSPDPWDEPTQTTIDDELCL